MAITAVRDAGRGYVWLVARCIEALLGEARTSLHLHRRGSDISGTEISELLGKTASAMLLADDYRIIVDANEPACEIVGLEREELIGMQIEDFSAPELRDVAPQMFEAFLAAGSRAGPFTLVRPDGTTVDCCYSASANIAPGVHLSILVPVEQADEELDVVEDEEAEAAPRLTDREREVLTLLALGDSNKVIAEKLHLSPETVRAHTRSARLRLGARSRSHAIALALRSGWLALDGSARPST